MALPAVLSLILVLHHPALHGVQGASEVAQEINGMAKLDGVVHGGLMLLYSMQAIGFYLFSSRLGWRRPAAVAGFMAYAASVLLLVIPATLDGFVMPDIIARCIPSP